MDQKYTDDIVIIWVGVIGCSAAYNLVNQGAIKNLLLEKGDICSEVQPNPVLSPRVITQSKQICIIQLKV